MDILLVLFCFVVFFSLLTIAELFLVRKMGFDVVARLRMHHQSGQKTRFFFEAFGAVAFVVGQPVILMVLLVWAFGEVSAVDRATTALQEAFVGAYM